MISATGAVLKHLSIHRIGNKANGEYYHLSAAETEFSGGMLPELLTRYFLSPFEKIDEFYGLYHPSGELDLNEAWHFCTTIFADQQQFHEESKKLGTHLFHASNHQRIKSGELYVAYFHGIQHDGELYEVIGLFKSETKEPYIKVVEEEHGFSVGYEAEAINIQRLDKGCLVFKTGRDEGYKIAVIDQTNGAGDAARFWKDDFLQLKVLNDNFTQTKNTLQLYKRFVTEKLDEEFELDKADKIGLLNRSMEYFKEHEVFKEDEFTATVLQNPQSIASFTTYKSAAEKELGIAVPDRFEISDAAVKKQSRMYKSILKLDKNFHVYIHGKQELIEKGYDEQTGMKYYKLYYKEEA